MNEAYYIVNRETRKLELHFSREEYQALTESQRAEIKSAFLWGRRSGCWISRAQEPNLWRAKQVAQAIGLEDGGETGDKLTFAEREERKQQRAERRAERYEDRAETAAARCEALQKPINDKRGDIAFFTQPNIATSAGRAFTRQRERMFAAYEKGFDEFRKSEYWQERAKVARKTATGEKLQDRAFICRRIEEAKADARKLRREIDQCEARLAMAAAGIPDAYTGKPINAELVRRSQESYTDRLEEVLDKLGYYQDALAELGGVEYNRQNIKPGYIVRIRNYPAKVISTGPKNVKVMSVGFCLAYPYAEITEIISTADAAE